MQNYVIRFAFTCALACIAFHHASAETLTSERSPFAPVQVGQRVEIFVTAWCSYCKRLENYLRSRNIPFTRYDVEKDPKGEAVYNKLGGGGVPITRIGSMVLRGFDEVEFDKIFRKPSTPATTS